MPIIFLSMILIVSYWVDQAALDRHHQSPMMIEIAILRKKYGLRFQVNVICQSSNHLFEIVLFQNTFSIFIYEFLICSR